MTGLRRPELLRASHIKPWSGSNNIERLDVDYGLLLSAAYDAAFDACLIGFRSDGLLYLADGFDEATAVAAGINPAACVSSVSAATAGYLAAHAELVSARARRASSDLQLARL